MFVLDSVLLAPFRAVVRAAREIQRAARQERASAADAIRTQLRELYMRLETGRITEEEFETREGELLDRLDAMEAEDVDGRDGAEAQGD